MFEAATITTQEFLTSLSFDAVVCAALVAFFFVLGLRGGKIKLIAILFSTYTAGLLLVAFPFRDYLDFSYLLFDKYDATSLVLLIGLIIAIRVVLDYVLELEFDGKPLEKTFHSLVLSVAASITFLSVSYMSGIVENVDPSASYLDTIFTNGQYLFALLILPLVAAFLVAR